MKRLAQLLAVRPGEGRLAGLVIGVMLLTSAGSALGGAGIETLFYTRFGVQYLPYMFMILSVVTITTSLGITALLGRLPRERLYVALPLAVAIFLLAARLLLTFNFRTLYPLLWIGKEVANNLIGFMVWGAAGMVFDSRQARRLFPLFGAGRILGSVLGGLLTGWFVSLAGTENLVAFWVAAMLLAFVFSRLLLRGRVQPAPRRGARPGGQPGFFGEIRNGYQYIRRSSLMLWISIAAVLFSVLFFSIALPFSRAATLQYPQEAALAGFLGAFQGLSTAAAFLASLFLANRLSARYGIMAIILAGPVTYLLGFGAMALAPVFIVIAAFRFVQMLWLAGLADPAWQAMFNVVSSERRDQVRAFMGIPDQAGTMIAGLVLLIGQQALTPRQLSLIGLLSAAACTYVVWRSRRAYNLALVEALRLGRPHVFLSEEEPFGGLRRDSAATAALIAGIRSEDLGIRRVATEILGQVHIPESAQALVSALSDPDAVVRRNALKALASGGADSLLPQAEHMLRDPDPDVRIEAIACLGRLQVPEPPVQALEPLLHDPLPSVRMRAAAALLGAGPHEESLNLLRQMIVSGDLDSRLEALELIPSDFELVAAQLSSSWGLIRRAAARALVRLDPQRAFPILLELLREQDVRETAARELGRLGGTAVEPLLAALSDPEREEGALLALKGLPIGNPGPVEAFARRRATQAVHYDTLLRGLPLDGERAGLLAALLREKAHRHGIAALRAVALLGDGDAISLAVENLEGQDAAPRASVLEALESTGEPGRGIIRPLIVLWEDGVQPAGAPLSASPLGALLTDPDPWVRACAAFAAQEQPAFRPALKELSRSDPVPLVREAALVTNGEPVMETLPTLSLMERILFLRGVPLFEKLSTTDLKMVAALADEVVFSDGEEIARQDEPGDTMYIIVSGEVVVKAAKADGGQRELARRGPGTFVGEMSIISQEPRMASLAADGDVRTLCIDHRGFQGLLRERPELSLAVMHELSTRIREMARKA